MSDQIETVTPVLQNALADIILSSVSNAGAAKEFIIEQTPSVIQQLLTFNLVWHSLWVIIGLLLIAIAIWGKNKINKIKDFDPSLSAEHGGMVIGIAVSFLFGFLFILANFKDTIMLWFAPKVWLIEYAATLVKSNA